LNIDGFIVISLIIGIALVALQLTGKSKPKLKYCVTHNWSLNNQDESECLDCGFIVGRDHTRSANEN
jgi:hypothetical protein